MDVRTIKRKEKKFSRQVLTVSSFSSLLKLEKNEALLFSDNTRK
jgi:hypothetical protein